MIIPALGSTQIDLGKPVFTVDVHGVALRDPSAWPEPLQGLAPLEWNYFKSGRVALCVTPELQYEITRGQDLASLPWTAYQRYKKSQLFKSRPSGTTLSLTAQDADTLWTGISDILWPRIPRGELNTRQRADVSQLYFHTVANSSVTDSAFLTCDGNTLGKTNIIRAELGVNVLTFTDAWDDYQPRFSLDQPTAGELSTFAQDQSALLQQLSTRSSL